MIHLTLHTLGLTEALLEEALTQAAAAFSKMVNDTIVVRQFTFQQFHFDSLSLAWIGAEQGSYVLNTQIKGDLKGDSYLLFASKEVVKVFHVIQTSEATVVTQALTEFQKALLLEIDNVFTAALVTPLANHSGVFTYGDVPYLHYVAEGQPLIRLDPVFFNTSVVTQIYAELRSATTGLTAAFVCFFP
jgi:chemotaxis protein CheY-P-specific phosphatase CheC